MLDWKKKGKHRKSGKDSHEKDNKQEEKIALEIGTETIMSKILTKDDQIMTADEVKRGIKTRK